MKVTISYKYKNDGTGGAYYWAYTTFNGEYIPYCANSYEDAKQGLLTRLARMIDKGAIPPPSDEEVEIPEASHANS